MADCAPSSYTGCTILTGLGKLHSLVLLNKDMLWPGLVEPPVDITIPPPIVVRTPVLVVFYWMLMSLDYLVLKYESKIPLSKMQVRIVLAIVHVAIPLVIASSRVAANLFFIALPWFYAAYSSLIPVEKYSYREWSESLQYLLLDAPDDKRLQLATRMIPKLELSKQEQRDARIKGAARIGRGVCKLIVMKLIVDPLLPEQQQLSSMLMLPWLHPTSLLLTLLFGCKAYFFLGVADVGMGLQQVSLGVPTVDLFDRPMIAATPREFWSRRWNIYMRRLHHLLIFAPGRGARGDGGGDKRKVNRKLRGLFVFFISGVYHEVLLLSLFRRTSGENLLFFTLQGLIVLLEINVREKTGYKQDVSGWIKVLCYVCFWTSLAVSGRVFLAPFLRFFSM